MISPSSKFVRTLEQVDAGDKQAAAELYSVVMDELQDRLAEQKTLDKAKNKLQATAVVHNTYIQVAGPASTELSESGSQFYIAAAKAMRQILTEYARTQRSPEEKQPPMRFRIGDTEDIKEPVTLDQLLLLNDTLSKLEQTHGQVADFVELRLYGGLPSAQAAKVLKLDDNDGHGLWQFALAWFAAELMADDCGEKE